MAINETTASSRAPAPGGAELPLVSIIIANYNGLRYLGPCFDALARQTYPAELTQVILVDDGSTDESVPFVQAHYPTVEVIRQPVNGGFVASCHAGAAAARGEWLVMLNNDTEPEPGWLAALVAAGQANPRAGAVASKMLLYDRREVLHNAGDTMGRDGIPRNRGVWQTDTGQYDGQTAIFGACGGGAAYRRAAWQQTGGFDGCLWMYLEDVDMAWRLHLLGWEVVFAPEARLYHHLSATGGGLLASYYTGRNTIWVIAKDMPGPLVRRNLGRILAAQTRVAVDAARAWRGKEARARLRGQLAGLLGLPRAFGWRRATQATRCVSVEEIERLLSD
jgi:GT2 family glycosyltransferase